MRLLLVLALTVLAPKKEEERCIDPPARYAKEVLMLGCAHVDGKSTCLYQFITGFPHDVIWRCTIILEQDKCRLPFKPKGIHCDPFAGKPPVEAKL